MDRNYLFLEFLLKCENYWTLSYWAGVFVLNWHPESTFKQNMKGFGVKCKSGTKKDSSYLREHMVLLLFTASDNVGWCQWMNREQSDTIMIKATLCMRAVAWKMLVVEKRGKRERFIDRKTKSMFPHITQSKEILDYKPPPNAWSHIFFPSIVTFKIYLLSLLLRSHWSFFPSLSSRVHWFTVFTAPRWGENWLSETERHQFAPVKDLALLS